MHWLIDVLAYCAAIAICVAWPAPLLGVIRLFCNFAYTPKMLLALHVWAPSNVPLMIMVWDRIDEHNDQTGLQYLMDSPMLSATSFIFACFIGAMVYIVKKRWVTHNILNTLCQLMLCWIVGWIACLPIQPLLVAAGMEHHDGMWMNSVVNNIGLFAYTSMMALLTRAFPYPDGGVSPSKSEE